MILKTTIEILLVNILGLSLLGLIVNMSLPNGNFKKYVKFMINIVMLAVILKPFLDINSSMSLDRSMLENHTVIEREDLEFKSQSIDRAQRQQIEELFKKKVENQIEMQLTSIMEDKNVIATVELEDVADDTYGIRSIYVKLEDSEIKGTTIEVGARQNRGESNELIEYLSSLYNVSKENIVIEARS